MSDREDAAVTPPASTGRLTDDQRRLVEEHLHLVEDGLSCAIRQVELWSAGHLGLIKAAMKFDPGKGASFATWARRLIRQARAEWSRKEHGRGRTEARPTTAEVLELQAEAPELPLSAMRPRWVRETCLRRRFKQHRRRVVNLSELMPSRPYVDHRPRAPEMYFGDDELPADWNNPADHRAPSPADLAEVNEVLSALSPRERDVVEMRAAGASLSQVGKAMGVSKSTINQIHRRAREKIIAGGTHDSSPPAV